MNVTPLTQAGQSAQKPPEAAMAKAAGASKPAISADFETFLKMLTAQMKNQDPLDPIDSADYAVQLATFSSVEQQVKTNDLLTGLPARMGATGMAQMAGWIGLEARAAAPARFDGAPLELSVTPAGQADRAILVVRDAKGEVVQRLDIPPGSDRIDWAGTASGGAALPSGIYSFDVESHVGGAMVSSEPAQTYSRVQEARIEGGAVVLVLETGDSVAADKVTALRSPS